MAKTSLSTFFSCLRRLVQTREGLGKFEIVIATLFTYAHLNTLIDQSMRAPVLSLLFYEITLQQSIGHFYNSWTPDTQHCPMGKGVNSIPIFIER